MSTQLQMLSKSNHCFSNKMLKPWGGPNGGSFDSVTTLAVPCSCLFRLLWGLGASGRGGRLLLGIKPKCLHLLYARYFFSLSLPQYRKQEIGKIET